MESWCISAVLVMSVLLHEERIIKKKKTQVKPDKGARGNHQEKVRRLYEGFMERRSTGSGFKSEVVVLHNRKKQLKPIKTVRLTRLKKTNK